MVLVLLNKKIQLRNNSSRWNSSSTWFISKSKVSPKTTPTSLIDHPSITEIKNYSDDESLSVQTSHGTYPSVEKQSLNSSTYDPTFFKYRTNFIDFFLPSETPLGTDPILKKKNPAMQFVYADITEGSGLLKKKMKKNAFHHCWSIFEKKIMKYFLMFFLMKVPY